MAGILSKRKSNKEKDLTPESNTLNKENNDIESEFNIKTDLTGATAANNGGSNFIGKELGHKEISKSKETSKRTSLSLPNQNNNDSLPRVYNHEMAGRLSSGNFCEKSTKSALISILNFPRFANGCNSSKSNDESTKKNMSDHNVVMHKKAESVNQQERIDPGCKDHINDFQNLDDLYELISKSRRSSDYTELEKLLGKMYSSFRDLLAVLKVEDNIPSNSEIKINFEYLDFLHESMIHMPSNVKKVILRSIIQHMLQDTKRLKSIDCIRGYLILLMNPLFNDSSTYIIFAHVLRQVGSMVNKEHQYLIMWFKKLPVKQFENIISRIRNFINYKLLPARYDTPETEKGNWWIPNAVKVMALLNTANDQSSITGVPYKDFYIQTLDSVNLVKEFHSWEYGSQNFSLCQYPFVLSLNAKRLIMQKDSETKMLLEARQSLVNKFRQKEIPKMGMMFLNLHVRRKHIVEDSLREISKKEGDLKKKLRVIFKGEPAIDLGGVSKEWFFLIIQRLFNEDYGMFTYNKKTNQWWFSISCKDNNKDYNLCGVLLGLAMYNGINLDIRFPLCVYKKLLSPAIVPYSNPYAPVGVAKFGMEDFKAVFPDLAKGLQELLDYDGNVEDDLCQSFQISFSEYGQIFTRFLKPGGDDISVTNENREEYVNLYINYLMNKSIYQQFYSFYHGFHSVCASNALLLLRAEEVETMVIGNPEFNIKDLQKIAVYDGYTASDITIRYFWDAAHEFNEKAKKKLLLFCTGSDRIPVGGMNEMNFKITRIGGQRACTMLPMAHTCFNQLCLPPYKSRKLLTKKLSIAIENAEGFGLE